MIRSIQLAILALFIVISTAYATLKTTETFTAAGTGDAEIVKFDYIDARINAKAAATQQALWKIVNQLVPAAELQGHTDQIQAALIARAMDYVQKYKFSEEVISEDNTTYHVGMEVVFFAEPIRAALEDLGTAVTHRKKVVIVIDERPLEVVSDISFLLTGSVSEDRLRAAAAETGFKTIDRAEVRALKNDQKVIKAVEGDEDAVRWLAAQFKAEYVITGRARATAIGAEMMGKILLNVYAADGSVVWSKEIIETVQGSGGMERFKVIRLCGDKGAVMVSELLLTRR